jgi:hypothetical protein
MTVNFTNSFFIPKFFAYLLCAYNLGLYFFGERILAQKLLIKCWWNWHQMAVPVPSISCRVLNHHNLFYQIQNALAFNWDTCCLLALCLQLLPFHSIFDFCLDWSVQWRRPDLRELIFECSAANIGFFVETLEQESIMNYKHFFLSSWHTTTFIYVEAGSSHFQDSKHFAKEMTTFRFYNYYLRCKH